MIFVTVGSDKGFGFKRLIEACDRIASEISEPMHMQIAVTRYEPRHASFSAYMGIPEYLQRFRDADLIISHCSIGPIVNALRFSKRLIVVPRRHAFGELADEHQLEFARTVEMRNIPNIRVVYETAELSGAVQASLTAGSILPFERQGLKNLVARIRDYTRQFEGA